MSRPSHSHNKTSSSVFVVRLHFEYDRDNYSSTEAVFTDKSRALRYAVLRIIGQKIDNDCVYLFSTMLATKLGLSDLGADIIEEKDTEEVQDCLESITSTEELKAIYEDAIKCQKDSGALEQFFVDEIGIDDA